MGRSFHIATIGGTPIRLHVSFLVVLPFIAWASGEAFFELQRSAAAAGVPLVPVQGPPFLWGVGLALALFASVLVHELAHTRYALHLGREVHDITLFMIGGVSNVREPPERPRHEALMALVGPLASLALGGAFLALDALLAATPLAWLRFAAFYLALMNFALGIFNLVPAFPMDGGRILRAGLAARLGIARATRVAATVGKVLAAGFVVLAFLSRNPFLAVVGLFVFLAAEAEARQVSLREALRALTVGDLQRPAPEPVAGASAVEEAAARMLRDGRSALVAMAGEALLGVVLLSDVERVPPARRGTARVDEVVRDAPQVSGGASAWDALRLMTERRLPTVPVVADGRVVGVLDRDDVLRAVRLRERAAAERRAPPARERAAW